MALYPASRPTSQRHTLSVLVENRPGVLSRIAGLFARRAFNINSLSVSPTERPDISRITVTADVEEVPLEQIIKQLLKLEEVQRVDHLQEDDSCCSELVFVKLHAENGSERDAIRQLCDLYDAHIVESTEQSMIVELSEVPSRIDAFLDVVSNFEVMEMSRSGVTAIQK